MQQNQVMETGKPRAQVIATSGLGRDAHRPPFENRRSMQGSRVLYLAVLRQSLREILALLGLSFFIAAAQSTVLIGQEDEVKIWEFSPYSVGVWYEFDANVTMGDKAKQLFINQLDATLQRTFRASWKTEFAKIPPTLSHAILDDFDGFSVADLQAEDLVLVTSAENEQSKTVRSFAAAITNLTKVHLASLAKSRLENQAERLNLETDAPTRQLLNKSVVDDSSYEAIIEKLKSGAIAAALIPRSTIPQDRKGLRPLVTLFPWQAESVFRRYDKLFLLHVSQSGDKLGFRVRELDCPMRFLGASFDSSTVTWSEASRVAAATFIQAFAPTARVEQAEPRTAKLTMRAGGLITDDWNPSRIAIGDLLEPVVRRDDRNGIPTLLQPLSFTFAAVTGSDGINLDSNVYTYSGGPGLEGRKNRRTSRVLFRVRPKFDETQLKIAVINADDQPQTGCFIYQKDLINDEFDYLGRTDWRGQLTIPVPTKNGSFLADATRKERILQKRDAMAKAEEDELQNSDEAQPTETAEIENDADSFVEEIIVSGQYDAENDADAIALRHPFIQIYIKSGETVLARLPMVPGLKAIEVAELPDDTARLQAEAFVKGFQGDILDLIGLRNLLAAQVQLAIKNAVADSAKRKERLDQAEEILKRLQVLPTYSEMATKLERIQRELRDKRQGRTSPRAQNRIDTMFKVTRNMLEKFLQDDLIAETEQAFKLARSGENTKNAGAAGRSTSR